MLSGQLVSIFAKSEDRLDPVVSVGKFFTDVQSQVELRVRRLAKPAHGAAVSRVRPAAIFVFSRTVSASSAVASAALQAKRASNLRPAE